MKDVVLCDLDHVVCDAFWRDGMIGGPGGWDAYHCAAAEDMPIDVMVRLVGALHRDGILIYGLTARPEKWRDLTVAWLVRHRCFMTDVLMRPDNDLRPSPQVKLDLARPLLDRVLFLIDDRDDICAAFRAEGIVVLQAFVGKTNAPLIPFEQEPGDGRGIL